jgi:hypothetical protein
MNLGRFLSLVFLSCLPLFAAQPLQVRCVCFSVLIRPADLRMLGITYHNEVGVYDTDIHNGELSLAPPEFNYTHWGTFFYTDPNTLEEIPLNFVVDLPSNADGNILLLEYSLAVSKRTIGQYIDPEGNVGTFKADWAKAANSTTGTVKITFDFMGTAAFTHNLEIFSYSGEIASYTRDGAKINAPVTLLRDGAPDQKLIGPLVMSADAMDKVSLTSTNFTTEAGVAWNWFAPETFDRSGNEYYQFLGVIDGTPPDAPEDFNTWVLDIVDPNDDDSDGIPNLSDFTPPAIPQPTLDISKIPTGIRVIVHGDIGRTYTLQSTPTISPTVWFDFLEIKPDANPYLIDLPATDTATFYRLRTP